MLISDLLIEKMKQSSHSLEKSLNSILPLKILNFLCKSLKLLEFSSTLNVVAWKVCFDAFWLSRTEYKS